MSEGGEKRLGEPSNHSADKFPGLLGPSLRLMGQPSGSNLLPEAIPLTKVELSFVQFRVRDPQEGNEGSLGGNPFEPPTQRLPCLHFSNNNKNKQHNPRSLPHPMPSVVDAHRLLSRGAGNPVSLNGLMQYYSMCRGNAVPDRRTKSEPSVRS